MTCPSKWAAGLTAADELRGRRAGVRRKPLRAGWLCSMRWRREGLASWASGWLAEADSYGITDGLVLKAVGPDSEEIPEEEMQRRF